MATGGTLQAAAGLIETHGSSVCGIGAVIGLPFLGYPELLKPWVCETLVTYDHE